MKIVVYLDILLVTNFIAGYFLLRAAGWLAGASCPALRALAGAALAAASTLILLAPALAAPLNFAYKIFTAALVTLAAFGWHGLRPFLRAGTWFFVLNLGLAGFAMLYMQQTNRDSKIRLVLLDEAFSKMDKERSEVCLRYARELELQLIVCVPDERLQSLIRNVDSVYGFRRFKNQVSMMHIDKGDYLRMLAGDDRDVPDETDRKDGEAHGADGVSDKNY